MRLNAAEGMRALDRLYEPFAFTNKAVMLSLAWIYPSCCFVVTPGTGQLTLRYHSMDLVGMQQWYQCELMRVEVFTRSSTEPFIIMQSAASAS